MQMTFGYNDILFVSKRTGKMKEADSVRMKGYIQYG